MKGQGQCWPFKAVKLRLKVPDSVTLFSNDGAPVSPQRSVG